MEQVLCRFGHLNYHLGLFVDSESSGTRQGLGGHSFWYQLGDSLNSVAGVVGAVACLTHGLVPEFE